MAAVAGCGKCGKRRNPRHTQRKPEFLLHLRYHVLPRCGGLIPENQLPMRHKVKTERTRICNFCGEGDEVTSVCGKLYQRESLVNAQRHCFTAHRKCMQYSAGLTQYADPEFGGFDVEDVHNELKRGRCRKIRPCDLCSRKLLNNKATTGPTAGCALKSCKRNFHFLCASKVALTRRMKSRKDGDVLYRVFCSDSCYKKYTTTDKLGKRAVDCDSSDTDDCDTETCMMTNKNHVVQVAAAEEEDCPSDEDIFDGSRSTSAASPASDVTWEPAIPGPKHRASHTQYSQQSDTTQQDTKPDISSLCPSITDFATVTVKKEEACDDYGCPGKLPVYYCYRCKKRYCAQHKVKHDAMLSGKGHASVPLSSVTWCEEHHSEPCQDWCGRCRTPICDCCIMGSHGAHDVISLEDMESELRGHVSKKNEIESHCGQLRKMLSSLRESKDVANKEARLLISAFSQFVTQQCAAVNDEADAKIKLTQQDLSRCEATRATLDAMSQKLSGQGRLKIGDASGLLTECETLIKHFSKRVTSDLDVPTLSQKLSQPEVFRLISGVSMVTKHVAGSSVFSNPLKRCPSIDGGSTNDHERAARVTSHSSDTPVMDANVSSSQNTPELSLSAVTPGHSEPNAPVSSQSEVSRGQEEPRGATKRSLDAGQETRNVKPCQRTDLW